MMRQSLDSRRCFRQLALLAALVSALLAAGGQAWAQGTPSSDQGPRFGQWGPGQSAPAPEGGPQDDVSPAQPDRGGSPPIGRSPGAAPSPYFVPPGGEYAPAPGSPPRSGCSHDLRGGWQISGRQSEPYFYHYTARIQVRQFQQWLKIDQPDDGVSYYGICRGDRIELDVYAGDQFIGYEDGYISAGGNSPWWGGSSPWQPRRSLRVQAEWVSYAGGPATGFETWQRR